MITFDFNRLNWWTDELLLLYEAIFKRYQSLHEPVQIRRDNLEDALQLYQFLRDANDELSWIREKQPTASSTDLGMSLSSVQSLQKKHQALEAEIQSHEPAIATVVSRGNQMTKSGHFALQQVQNLQISLLYSNSFYYY